MTSDGVSTGRLGMCRAVWPGPVASRPVPVKLTLISPASFSARTSLLSPSRLPRPSLPTSSRFSLPNPSSRRLRRRLRHRRSLFHRLPNRRSACCPQARLPTSLSLQPNRTTGGTTLRATQRERMRMRRSREVARRERARPRRRGARKRRVARRRPAIGSAVEHLGCPSTRVSGRLSRTGQVLRAHGWRY